MAVFRVLSDILQGTHISIISVWLLACGY